MRMSANNRVIWSEGLFLQPQHFQQQDRYVERYVETRCQALIPHSWGFTELELERDFLSIGKFGLRRAAGVFPDGTPFRMPDDDPLPTPLDVRTTDRDQLLFLAVPLRRPGEMEVDRAAAVDGLARHGVRELEARDASSGATATALLGVVATGRGGAAEFADFLMLQAINRYEPLLAHYADSGSVHPEALYQVCVSLAGELATFTTTSKRPTKFPGYRHDRLRESFEPVFVAIRAALSVELDQVAIAIPIEARKFGISVAIVPDRTLYSTAVFILAARADIPSEELRRRFPAQLKIGPAEKIRDLVTLQLPGVPVLPVPVAPRQIPYHAGFAYFELDQTSELWEQLKTSGGVALHIAGEFPGLALEFWAIRG
jgi:predicted component of type VI protein secretion system